MQQKFKEYTKNLEYSNNGEKLDDPIKKVTRELTKEIYKPNIRSPKKKTLSFPSMIGNELLETIVSILLCVFIGFIAIALISILGPMILKIIVFLAIFIVIIFAIYCLYNYFIKLFK